MDGGEQKQFDLEDLTLRFGYQVFELVRRLPRTTCNTEYAPRLLRSSDSVGANYIEADESLSEKEFSRRVKNLRKGAKESRYWLRLLDTQGMTELAAERDLLVGESTELMNIFGAILRNSA